MTVEDLGVSATLVATDARAATVAATPVPTMTITSSAQALQREELSRGKALATAGVVLACGILPIVPLLSGDPAMRGIMVSSLVLLVLGNGWMLYLTRDPRRWTPRPLAGSATLATLGVLGVITFFGIFSAAVVAAAIGIFVMSLNNDGRVAAAVYVTTAAGHAVLVTLTIAGVLPDRGLLPMLTAPGLLQVLGPIMLQALFLIAFLVARGSRRTNEQVTVELERAVRTIAVREAMLQEARQDFDRALGVGGRGRHSDQVIGSFRIGAVLGRGCMGEVYEAAAVATGAPAAVKLLQLERSADPEHLLRFHREVTIAASLRSPHVVEVLEVGDAAAPVPYLAMERLRGTDLAGWLRAHPRLPLAEVVELARQVATGLEAARAAGIVHRDLKPQNLFRVEQPGGAPRWKILDFGVSKLADHGGTLTAGHIVGTPQYMAPEQAAGLDVDHRADVYALAAVIYRCLTGRPPFAGSNAPALLYQVVHATPARPGELAPLSPAIDDVLMRGLAKRAAERHATAPELATALAEAARRA